MMSDVEIPELKLVDFDFDDDWRYFAYTAELEELPDSSLIESLQRSIAWQMIVGDDDAFTFVMPKQDRYETYGDYHATEGWGWSFSISTDTKTVKCYEDYYDENFLL